MTQPTKEPGLELAAVCGLYCEACSWYIATTEEPERLKRLATEMHFSEEESRCYGCRSERRLSYCQKCTMSACAAQRGITFCSECPEYPCKDLQAFQAARPHRIELWSNLERIRTAGYQLWLKEIRNHYSCAQCKTLNSAYDATCRKCGNTPSCDYVATHKQALAHYLKNKAE